MKRRITSILMAIAMILSCMGSYCAFAGEMPEDSDLASETVLFVNGSSTLEGEGDGTLQSPYKNFNLAARQLSTSGGTIVVTGRTDCSMTEEGYAYFENSGDILVTSVWDGVDYRNGTSFTRTDGFTAASVSVGAMLINPVENPGKVTFDKINIITTSWANWHLCAHPFEITSDTKIIYWWTDSSGAASGYYDDIKVQFMITGSNVKAMPTELGVLPEVRISAPVSASSRIYLGSRKALSIEGATIIVDSNVQYFYLGNNGSAVLTINGDIKLVANKKLTTIATDGMVNYESGDFSVIANHGSTVPDTIPEDARPKNGNWYLVKGASGSVLSHGERGRDFVVTLEDSDAYNFAIFTNAANGKTYAAPIFGGVGEITLEDSGVYTVSLTNAEAVRISFKDEVLDNTLEDIVAAKGNAAILPRLSSTQTHIFRGWTDIRDGKDVKYEAGVGVSFESDTVLYAVWSDAPKYTVSFLVDGEVYEEFVNIEGAKIEYPTEPSKDGYYFKKWDKIPETIGTEDITVNAVFVSRAEYGNVVYLDGTVEASGDGTIGRPFRTLKGAAQELLEDGGTIVVKGITTIEYSGEVNNTGDIVITSLDPVTGENYMAVYENGVLYDGAYLRNYKGAFLGNGIGKITFDNVALYATKDWNFFNLCAGETVLKDTVKIYLMSGEKLYTGGYFGFASQLVEDKNDINIKATIAAPATYYAAYLARCGENSTINSVDIVFDTNMKLSFSNNNDSVSPTVNGPVMFTVNKAGSGTRITDGGKQLTFGAKAYLSLITNDATVTFTEVEALSDRAYRISSDGKGKIMHTDTKGCYNVTSSDYNFAQLLSAEGDAVSETVIYGENNILKAPEYGEYTVSYSNKDIYSLEFISQNAELSNAMPEAYAALTDDEEGLTISLPAPSERLGYSFVGWSESLSGAAKYSSGDEFTISGNTTLYAVWKEILVYTVTFKNDEGEVIHTSSGYEGDGLTFPSKVSLPWDYEKKLLGFRYSDDTENRLIPEDARIPEGNKTAIPLWGEIPSGETRVYVSAESGADTNSGKTPSNAVATIDKAVSLIREDGGIIICTGGKITLTGAWNNKGNIILTSFDPLTGIDYRVSEISEDGLSWKSGAHLWHGAVQFGYNEIGGKITLDHLVLGTHGNYQFLNFDGHPFELGKGLSAYCKASETDKILTTQSFYIRALGEAGAARTNPDGIKFTLNTLGSGATLYAIGKAENTVPGIDITVDSEFSGIIQYGNNTGGGVTTLKGPGRFTFNASLKNSIRFPTQTNPVEGNLYVIYNNNSTGSVDNIPLAEGYGVITVKSTKDARITHGTSEGSFEVTLSEGYSHGYVKVLNESDNTVIYEKLTDGKAQFELSDFGNYTAQYTDVPCHKVTYDTGVDGITVPSAYFEDGRVAELASGLYRYGYTFLGWTDGEKDYTDGIITMPEKDITLTAIWIESPKYTVEFNANGAVADMPSSINDYVGEVLSLKKCSSEGRVFLGWSEDASAESGVMHHTIDGNATLYAIWSESAAYIMESYFIDDPRWQFQRYALDVYLDNGSATSGTVKFNIDSSFLYSLGRIPEDGIESSLTRSGRTLTLTWSGDVDATDDRVRLARIMLFYTEYGMGYDEVEKRSSDVICAPASGCIVDGKASAVSANFYKGKALYELEMEGRLTLEGRPVGVTPKYDNASVRIIDKDGETVKLITLENSETVTRSFSYTVKLIPGSYKLVAEKGGYKTRTVTVEVTEAGRLPDIVLYSGDTLDGNGNGDGKIDVSDFTRVLRGFSETFPLSKYIYAIDLNEDGVVNVSDLAIIKKNFEVKVGDLPIEGVLDERMKLLDWSIAVKSGRISVSGGSLEAIENAKAFIESEYPNDGGRSMPMSVYHTEEYAVSDILIGATGIKDYEIAVRENDAVAMTYAQYIRDEIASKTGYGLDIVTFVNDTAGKRIYVGAHEMSDVNEYEVYELSGKIYLNYGDEQSANMGADDLLQKLLGLGSGLSFYIVRSGARYEGSWEVLARFAVLSDTHVGKGKVPANPDWENYEGWLKPVYDHINSIHANPETRLDFVLSLGDNIDYGYDRTDEGSDELRDYDYNDYLRTIKWLTICDPENPIEDRAEGTIPHYELKGNHDPSGVVRFLDRGYWVTENESGKRVAFIGFFTNYGGYPNINGDTSTYFSYGNLTEDTVAYVEEMILKAVEDGAEQIVLSSHFGIAQDLGAPILPETGLGKIGALCDKYGIRLYFNGHEHDIGYTVRRYNDVYDIDASMTKSRHAIVEITTARVKMTVYNSSDNSVYREDVLPLN